MGIILIIACTSLVYFHSYASNGFTWDDAVTVIDCRAIRNWDGLLKMDPETYFHSFPELSYRPVVSASYVLDYQLWGDVAHGYHLTNVILHALVSVSVLFLGIGIFRRFHIAFVAALLVVVHPAFTEAVESISFREDLLAGMFVVLSVTLALSSLKTDRIDRLSYALSLATLVVALFSKEMSVTTPFLIIAVLLITRDRRFRKRDLTLTIPHFVIVLVYLILRSTTLSNPRETFPQYIGGSFFTAMFTMSRVTLFYLIKLFLPMNQSTHYAFDASTSLFDVKVVAAVLVMCLIVVAAVLARKHTWGITIGLVWFGIALLPVSNIVPVRKLIADRFLYLPGIGICLAISAFFFFSQTRKCSVTFFTRCALFVVLLAMMGAHTVARHKVWANDLALWRNAVMMGSENTTVHTNLGKGYAENDKLHKAVRSFARAVELLPSNWDALFNLGYAYLKLEKPDLALDKFHRVLASGQINAVAHEGLGQAFLAIEDFAYAEHHFRTAISLDPMLVRAYVNYGRVLKQQNKIVQAMSMWHHALRLDPEYDDAYYYLAQAYRLRGEQKQETEALSKFLELSPAGDRAAEVRSRLKELDPKL